MNKKIILLIIIYILFVLFQYFYPKYKEYKLKNSKDSKELADKIKYNTKNYKNINPKIYKILCDRVELLKKIGYEKWIEYNQQNVWVKVNGRKYFITIWYYTNKNFHVKTYPILKYINLSWDDFLKERSNNLAFSKYSTDKQLLLNMYHDVSEEYNVYSNYFESPFYNKIVRRNIISKKFDDGKFNTGVIYIPYEIENISNDNTLFYNKVLPIYVIIIFSLLSLFLSVLIFLLDITNFILPLSILIIINLYITYYVSIEELYGTLELELEKFTSISSGVLSISFLISASIFILSALQEKSIKNLFEKAAILFVVSFILLLISIFKQTNYTDYYNVAQNRITKQFIFNYTVLLNLFIILNYIIYVNAGTIKELKMFKKIIFET
jgi:hypothetical protein